MPGVIALLPEPFASRVEALWDEMTRGFGVPPGYSGAVPHITFHLGARDAEPGAASPVEAVAGRTAPFGVCTAGLGVFGGPQPVIHLAVARSPEVAQLAAQLDSAMEAAGFPTTDPYFSPQRWQPHITIAQGNLAGVELGPLLAWLVGQQLNWEIPVGSISVARETPTGADVLATFPLLGRAAV